MNKEDFKKSLKKAKYFCDSEGKLKIIEVRTETFLVEDSDGEFYELFYVDYTFNRQTFEII